MDVVNLLPDHPLTPQGHIFEALLPDQVSFIPFSKNKAAVCPNYGLRGNRFQLAGEFLDATVPGISYEMKVLRHEPISDQLAGPIAI